MFKYILPFLLVVAVSCNHSSPKPVHASEVFPTSNPMNQRKENGALKIHVSPDSLFVEFKGAITYMEDLNEFDSFIKKQEIKESNTQILVFAKEKNPFEQVGPLLDVLEDNGIRESSLIRPNE